MNLTYSQLLKNNRNFRNLFWGQLVSELGSWFNFVAGLGVVRVISNASPEAAGLLLFWRTLPFAVLMPFAGAVADRFSRRSLMFWTDIARGFFALVFLFVTRPEDLWIAYLGSILLSSATAFFDGAKNAATPNITGKDGLLAGTALMLSTRFLLMAAGSALGGVASLVFGYEVAFIINSLSFFVSAYSIWLIPEDAVREQTGAPRAATTFFSEFKEGLVYTVQNPFALTILLMNIIWATGGGATNMVFEGLGTKVFTDLSPDFVYAALLTANGLGLAAGMLIAHRVDALVTRHNAARRFIGWSLIAHGVLFAAAGLMPNLWIVAFFVVLSRLVIGAEFAVQETMFQRSLPDYIRGRISTLDRGAEITVFSLSGYLAGLSLTLVSAPLLTLVAGLLASSSGAVWFWRTREERKGEEEKGRRGEGELESC